MLFSFRFHRSFTQVIMDIVLFIQDYVLQYEYDDFSRIYDIDEIPYAALKPEDILEPNSMLNPMES